MDTNSTITGRTTTNSISSVRYMSVTAMLSAVAFILMFLDFSVPFMPAFIKMDLSEPVSYTHLTLPTNSRV